MRGYPPIALLLGFLVACTWITLLAVHSTLSQQADRTTLIAVGRFLNATSAVLALLVGSLCIVRRRLLDERADLYLGLGVLAFGGVRLGLAELLAPAVGTPSTTATEVTVVVSVGFVTTLGFLIGPSVSRAGRGPLLWTVAAGIALAVALPAVPVVGNTLVGRSDSPAAGHLAMALVWATVAGHYIRLARRRRRPLDAWVAFMLLVLTQGRLMFAFTAPDDAAGLLAGQVLRLEALLVLLVGVLHELRRGVQQRQAELLDTVRALYEDRRAAQAARQERDHDLRAALFAIGGTARNLERYHDRMDAGALEALAHALSAEASRLHRLVSERPRELVTTFSPADVVGPLVVSERCAGGDVALDAEPGAVVCGRPGETAEVVRNLLDNARRHAPGSPVAVRVELRDDWAVIVVRDWGPGVDPREREAIFERGRQGATACDEGNGLGLFVARRLMREQEGNLWVTPAPGGGACFVAALPRASGGPVGVAAEAIDEDDDVEQARRRN